jgi:hypothetical protein
MWHQVNLWVNPSKLEYVARSQSVCSWAPFPCAGVRVHERSGDGQLDADDRADVTRRLPAPAPLRMHQRRRHQVTGGIMSVVLRRTMMMMMMIIMMMMI